MSDFDEEAERERLREKYERDQQKRETTEKMSELLLQGATMTNAHCSECNDPIFRYDGQEFCATCEKPVDRESGEGETDQNASAIEVTAPSDDARVKFGGDGEEADTTRHTEAADRTRQPDPSRQETQPPHEQPAGPDEQRSQRRTADEDAGRPRHSRTNRQSGATDTGAVRDSLVRTLRRFSERAENCEDPQRARDHLAAAREAAETLAALRR